MSKKICSKMFTNLTITLCQKFTIKNKYNNNINNVTSNNVQKFKSNVIYNLNLFRYYILKLNKSLISLSNIHKNDSDFHNLQSSKKC